MTEDLADPVLMGVYQRLFHADTADEVDAAFTELGAIGEHYSREFKKAEDKARAKMGVPRVAAKSDMAQVLDDWGPVAGLPGSEDGEG